MPNTQTKETLAVDELFQEQLKAYNLHIQQRELLDSRALEISGRYDHWILTLSGGALGLSVGFFEKIVPTPHVGTLFLLGIAWFSLIIAVWSGLSSIFCSQYALQKEIEMGDQKYKSLGHSNPAILPDNCYRDRTHYFNYASIVGFTLGVLSFCLFAFINIAWKPVPPQVVQTEIMK